MGSAKQQLIELLKDLPDDSTLEEIQYHVYVRRKVQRGLRDVEEGWAAAQQELSK